MSTFPVLHSQPVGSHSVIWESPEEQKAKFFAAVAENRFEDVESLLQTDKVNRFFSEGTFLDLLNCKDESTGSTALLLATERGHAQMVLLLLDQGAQGAAEALFLAVRKEDGNLVKLFLDRGAAAHFVDNDGITPLLLAAQNGNVQIVEILLDRGALLDFQNPYLGRTALQLAVENGHIRVVKLLLDRGAQVNLQDKSGKAALHWVNGEVQIAELLLNRGAQIDLQDQNRETPLHWAAKNGHLPVVELLLNAKAQTLPDKNGKTALLTAIEGGHVDSAALLIQKAPSTIDSRDRQGTTPLVLAAKKGYTELVKLLIAQGPQDGPIALSCAIASGHAGIVEALLDWVPTDQLNLSKALTESVEKKYTKVSELLKNKMAQLANFSEPREKRGEKLFSAVIENRREEVEALLKKDPTLIHFARSDGSSALLIAAEYGHARMVELLLDQGANVHFRNHYGNTALHMAVDSGRNIELIELLLNRGADVNLQNKEGKAALHKAVEFNDATRIPIVELLFNRGARLDLEDINHMTPFLLAASRKKPNSLEVFLNRGTPVDWQNHSRGWTALQVAAKFGQENTIRMLLDRGAQINLQNQDGETALHWAVSLCLVDLTVLTILLTRLAQTNIQDKKGRTPLHRAAEKNHSKALFHLLLTPESEVDLQDGEGKTALHVILYPITKRSRLYPEECTCIKYLINAKARTDLKDKNGNTALDLAQQSAFLDRLTPLLSTSNSETQKALEPQKNQHKKPKKS